VVSEKLFIYKMTFYTNTDHKVLEAGSAKSGLKPVSAVPRYPN
jgi:hypothetical protein